MLCFQNNQEVRLLRLLLLGNKTRTKKQNKIKADNERSSFGPGIFPSNKPFSATIQLCIEVIDPSKSTPLNQFTQHLAEKNLSYPKIIGEPINSSLVGGS